MDNRRSGIPKSDVERAATHFNVSITEVTGEMIHHVQEIPRGSGLERQEEAEKNKELLLDILEHEAVGGGLVVNPARAAATPCKCYKIEDDGFEMCFSPGIIGSISSKANPEQIAQYCAVGKEYLSDGITKRIKEVRSAIHQAHERWEAQDGTLPEWWEEVSKSLKEHKIEL